MARITVFAGNAPINVDCGNETSGVTVQNRAGGTVNYSASRYPDSVVDGQLVSGASATLAGSQWFYVPKGLSNAALDVGELNPGSAAFSNVTNLFTNTNQFQNYTTFGSPSTVANSRSPWKSRQVLGPSSSGEDHIGHLMHATIVGDWTADGGTDAKIHWGLEVYATTGGGVADGTGTNLGYGALIEYAVAAGASSSINRVVGLQAEASFSQATAAATVADMRSLYVRNPSRKDGATGGVATAVYGLYVETVAAASVGATTAFSAYVAGGNTQINGSVQVASTALGFFGATAAAKQTVAAAATDLASVITLANSLRTLTLNYGLA